MSEQQKGSGILTVNLLDISELSASYMPFLINGGIFIATNHKFELNQEVFLLIKVLDEAEKIPVAGKVVWLSPQSKLSNRVAGIGVEFNDANSQAKNILEKHLAGELNNRKFSHTI